MFTDTMADYSLLDQISDRISSRASKPLFHVEQNELQVLRAEAPCLHPVRCWRCGSRFSKDGILSDHLVFSHREASLYFQRIGWPDGINQSVRYIPCGKCSVCQIRKRKEWSTRLVCESRMHDTACFLTLTYNDDNLPRTDPSLNDDPFKSVIRGLDDGLHPIPTLCVRDLQLFMKRLRRRLYYHQGLRIRFFGVGEYGTRSQRPHYHVIIFGWKPADCFIHTVHNGKPIYRSPLIEDLWTLGYSSVSDVNTQVAQYCARYVTKKFARLNNAADSYDFCKQSEFTVKSVRNGSIGAPWLDVNYRYLVSNGFITYMSPRGIRKASIPPYFIQRLRKLHPEAFNLLRARRKAFRELHKDERPLISDLMQKVELDRHTSWLQSFTEVF